MPEEINLETLYQQMYELTNGHCGCDSSKPYLCCEAKYCEQARYFASEHYGVILASTGHVIPFMGPQGCTIKPHLRPICTLHACQVSWGAGEFQGDPERTREYFDLRERILKESKKQNKHPFIAGGAGMDITSQQGAVLSVVRQDGTVDVWSIPTNATISILPAKGFGGLSEIDTADSLAGAESVINSQLASFGAQ